MTLDCLQSVIAETTVPYELIVLDNRSPDGSAAAIAEAFPDVRLIASQENHGFARGNNVAAREARGKYLLLLNPDTLVLDRAIDRLVAFAGRAPQAGIWGGAHAQRRRHARPHELLRPPDALEPVLPHHRARAGLPRQPALQSRALRRLGSATASATWTW